MRGAASGCIVRWHKIRHSNSRLPRRVAWKRSFPLITVGFLIDLTQVTMVDDHEKDEEDAPIPSMTIEDALSELQSSQTHDCNTTRNQKLAKHILTTLEIDFPFPGKFANSMTVLRDLAEFAVTRRNLELWIETSSYSVAKHYFLTQYQSDVRRACQVFGFSNLRSRCAPSIL